MLHLKPPSTIVHSLMSFWYMIFTTVLETYTHITTVDSRQITLPNNTSATMEPPLISIQSEPKRISPWLSSYVCVPTSQSSAPQHSTIVTS
jgi:hypothetical protein